MIPKKSPAKWGSPASSHMADSDSGGLAVKLDKLVIREVLIYVTLDLQEVSSRGFEEGKAQLILPSQKSSLRMQWRLLDEQRLLERISYKSEKIGRV